MYPLIDIEQKTPQIPPGNGGRLKRLSYKNCIAGSTPFSWRGTSCNFQNCIAGSNPFLVEGHQLQLFVVSMSTMASTELPLLLARRIRLVVGRIPLRAPV